MESEDDWAPIKSPLGRGGQDADACAKYNSKYWLHGGDIAYLLRAFSMFEGETPDNAMSFDYLLEKIQVAFEAGASLQWECAIINTATRDHCGEHWNLALWRLHRGRLQFTEWEPYDHGRYSKHIRESVESAFPEGAVTYHTFNVGVQKRGDGWSCGYICTWWQLVVLKLLRDQCAPRSWDNPTPPPPCWTPLVWCTLRVRDQQWACDMHGIDESAGSLRSCLLKTEWMKAIGSGSFDQGAVDKLKSTLAAYSRTLKVHTRRSTHVVRHHSAPDLSFVLGHRRGCSSEECGL